MPGNDKITSEDIELMQKTCLLCDNSDLDIRSGCLFFKDGEILSEGWNVSDDFCDGGVMHAEEMALKKAFAANVSLKGSTCYLSRFSCPSCTQKLIDVGVTKVFYMSDHFSSNNAGRDDFVGADISVFRIKEETVW